MFKILMGIVNMLGCVIPGSHWSHGNRSRSKKQGRIHVQIQASVITEYSEVEGFISASANGWHQFWINQ